MRKSTLVHHFLEQSAVDFPDRSAIFFQDQRLTYREINDSAEHLARFLCQIGVGKQDRVALLLENSFEYVVALFGIFKAGAVAVPIHAESRAETIRYVLQNSDSRVLIGRSRYSRELLPALRTASGIGHVILDAPADHEIAGPTGRLQVTKLSDACSEASSCKAPPAHRVIDIDLAEIVYTSGSTGKPKGVMLSHLNLVSNMYSIDGYLELTPEDRIMAVLPFSYIYGQSLLLTHFLAGGSLVIDNRFVFPNAVLESMRQLEVTGFAGVPSTFNILLSRSAIRDYSFPRLRYVMQAGGAMAPDVQLKVAEIFKPAKLFVMYGSTEAAPRLSYLEPCMLPSKLGSIGKAVPNCDLFVADENGQEVPRGKEGELAARGSNIMSGYWKDEEGTRQALRNGLYFTGDLGVMDEDGFLYIIGRSKDIMKIKGFRVSPKEIEEKLMSVPEVAEAAVVGVDDPIKGEAVIAFVMPQAGAVIDREQLVNAMNKGEPAHKHIADIRVVDELPKNTAGKIDKGRLKSASAKS